MTDIPVPKPALGVGSIIGETFRVWLANIWPIFVAAFLPQIVILLVAGAVLTAVGAAGGGGPVDPSTAGFGVVMSATVVLIIALLVVWVSLTSAMITRIAYDAIVGRRISLGAALSGALPHVGILAVLFVAMGIVGTLGMMLLIVPGLYIYAMWCVTAPAVVVEKVGFGGLARSAALTKGYRWPVLGALLLMGLILMGISIAANVAVALIALATGEVVGAILQAIVSTLLYGAFYIVTVMVYSRLREIKEGVAVDDLAAVFD